MRSSIISWLLLASLVEVTGCATTRSEASRAKCPEPPTEVKDESILIADTIPLLRDEGLLCLIWQSTEEDGRILRVVSRKKGGFSVDIKRMSDEEREEFRQLAADAIRQTPAFKGRTLWQICGEKSGVKV